MNTEERTLPIAIVALIAITVAIAAIALASDLGALSGGDVQATDVTPTLKSGNPTCSDFQPQGQNWNELKVDSPGAGDFFDNDANPGPLQVTISKYTGTSFKWNSNMGVDAVFVKGGPQGNLYVYDPEATTDTGLTTPNNQSGEPANISHISFCYDVVPTLTVIKTVINDDGGTAVVGDFTLRVDGDSVTSSVANTVSIGAHVVSEADPGTGYTATIGEDCDASGNVTLAAGENKTCTITNDDVPPTPTPTPTPTTTTTTTPTPTPEVLAEEESPTSLPATGDAPAEGSGLGSLPLLLALSGLAFLGGAGALAAAVVRRRR